MYSRYADLSERRSAKKSGCKLNLQITRTTIVSVIAVSVAKAKAVLVSQMMMPPGHKRTAIQTNQLRMVTVARSSTGTFSARATCWLRASTGLRATSGTFKTSCGQ